MPATVWFGGGNAIKDSIKYKYDSCGNISGITVEGKAVNYTYDKLNRLIRENNEAFGESYYYSYDTKGNIIKKEIAPYTTGDFPHSSASVINYTYNGDKLTSYNGASCTYDGVGNPVIYRGQAATWQGRKLTSLGGVTFTYDGKGRRISKNNVTYTYDSKDRLIAGNAFEFYYDDNGLTGFVYCGTKYYYQRDMQGNIIAILDRNGNLIVKYRYDAWGNHKVLDASGNVISSSSHIGNVNPFRYRGYFYDIETGLYYLKTRYYDPVTGRFLNMDSIDYADPETINGLNLYAYCGNNPIMNVDPTGEFFWLLLAAVLLFTPVGGTALQVTTSVLSYVGMAVASIFDEDIRNDMNAIGWNPFNSNETATLNSSKVSFYKGVPVFRTAAGGRSGSFGAILLTNNSVVDDLRHERGHNWQLMMMGIGTYGLMIGLPSIFEWSKRKYYDRPWEITADIFGGVKNRVHSQQDISRGMWYFAVSNLFGLFGYFFLINEYK